MVHKYGMVIVNSGETADQIIPPPAKQFEMMSANKWVKVSNTKSTGTQTDPISVSLKSRREMGFKLYPRPTFNNTNTDPETQWIEEYWETR
jgi:hypothetical protein